MGRLDHEEQVAAAHSLSCEWAGAGEVGGEPGCDGVQVSDIGEEDAVARRQYWSKIQVGISTIVSRQSCILSNLPSQLSSSPYNSIRVPNQRRRAETCHGCVRDTIA